MSLIWSFDENNVLNAHPQNPEDRRWAWIQPRPHYCDRGRLSWAQMGWDERVPMPSMYFMQSENAQKEIEAWVEAQTPPALAPHPLHTTPSSKSTWAKLAVSSGWSPHPEDPKAWVKTMLDEEDFPRMLVLREENTSSEVLYVLSPGNLKHIDHSDAFPRVYRHAEVALSEGALFLEHRLTIKNEFAPDELSRSSYKGLSLGQRPR